MKKILLILLLIVVLPVVLWLSSTWYISQQTESLFEQQLALSNTQLQHSSPQAKLEKTHYEKNLFGAVAKTHLTLPLHNATADVLELDFNHRISHGPIFWDDKRLFTGTTYWHTTLDTESLNTEQKRKVRDIFKQQVPLNVYTTTGFDNSADSQIEIAPMVLDENGEKLEISGIHIKSHNSMVETVQTTVEADIGEVRLSGAELDAIIPASVLKGSMTGNLGAMMTGEVDWLAKNIQFKLPQEPVTKLSAHYQAQLADNKGLLDAKGKLVLSDMQMPNAVPITNAHYDFYIAGLRIEGLQAFQVALHEFNEINMQMIEELSTEEASKSLEYYQEVITTYEPVLQEREAKVAKAFNAMLVPGKSKLKIDLGLSDPEANASALLKLAYSASASAQGINFAVSDPMAMYQLLQVFDIDLALKADEKLLALTPLINEVMLLAQQGLIQQNGKTYSLTAEMQQGKLLLNGQPFPLEALMMMQSLQNPNGEF